MVGLPKKGEAGAEAGKTQSRETHMRKLIAGLATVAVLAVVATAYASVTFDPETGTGFVGKGDVQTAFGWNNKALQDNAGGLTFTYASTVETEIVCEWMTGEGTRGEQTHRVSHQLESGVYTNIAYEARRANQITGFNLNGLGTPTIIGGVEPVIGAPCIGTGAQGTIVAIGAAASTGGGLMAHHDGESHPLEF
jgi:hypothetical protein